MKIQIGILGQHKAGWETLLRQEGVAFAPINGTEPFSDYSALVITSPLSADQKKYVSEYLRTGGGLLVSGALFRDLSGRECTPRWLKYMTPGAATEFGVAGFIDIDGDGCVATGAEFMHDSRSQGTVFVGEYGGGCVVVLPFDAGELICDNRISTRSFYAKRSRLPFERVSHVSRSGVRKLVARSLELLHHRRGLPYVHRWYYPDGAPSVFAFRIDTDYSGREKIDELYRLLEKRNVPGSWFVDVKSQQDILGVYREMVNQEIGVHCYVHETYEDKETNLKNILLAKKYLEEAKIAVQGFVAPFGKWNEGIAAAIAECGFAYSSEFAYDYDNLPSYPNQAGLVNPVMQVPVHPISIGGLRRQGFSKAEMIDYFRLNMEWKQGYREPFLYYHHPNDGHEPVLETIFDQMDSWNTPSMRFGEVAAWWKRRGTSPGIPAVADGTVDIPVESIPGLTYRVSSAAGELFCAKGGAARLAEQRWTPVPAPPRLPDDMARIRKFNPWVPLIRVENMIFK